MSKKFWQATALTLATILTTLVLVVEHIFTAQAVEISDVSKPQLIAQMTSITQLSDVRPTDYFYQSLQSLVEGYGCFSGFPDGTYKAERPIARAELAAELNACLDRTQELIASSTADLVQPEDVIGIQQQIESLQQEIALLRR